jgi:hypothetical protein
MTGTVSIVLGAILPDKKIDRFVKVKLPRFRGHPTFWVEGVHDVEAKSTLPT